MTGIADLVAASPFADAIANAEQNFSVPGGLLGAQLYQESTLGTAYGNGGGIGQFISSTGSQYGVDPNDPISGINGAAEYLSDLYDKSGSWVSALQSYGTLPSDISGSLTTGQQNVLNIAQAADSGTIQPLSSGTTQQTSTTVPAGSTASATPSSWTNTILSALGVGSIETFFFRVAIAILAFVVLMIALADLAFGQSPKQTVSKATGFVKGTARAVVAE